MQIRFVLILALMIWSCSRKSDENKITEFIIPELINSMYSDSLNSKMFLAESISETYPVFIGKYSFEDNLIDINPKIVRNRGRKEMLYEFYEVGIKDSFDINGLEMIVAYDREVSFNKYGMERFSYYPLFFVNSTNTSKLLLGKDSWVFGIQEARERSQYGMGRWRPIEARGFDFCGNGHWGLVIKPKEYVLILMNKYDGDFETELRVRIENGESLYVSKPFKGFVNEKQFKLNDKSYLKKNLIETNGKGVHGLFYGAHLNKEEWTKPSVFPEK